MSKCAMNKCYDCYVCGEHIGRPSLPGETPPKGICKECSSNPANLSPAQRAYREKQAEQNERGPSYDCYVCRKHIGRPHLPGEARHKGICKKCSRNSANLSPAQRAYRKEQARENERRRTLKLVAPNISAWSYQVIRPRRKCLRGRYK